MVCCSVLYIDPVLLDSRGFVTDFNFPIDKNFELTFEYIFKKKKIFLKVLYFILYYS